MNAPLITVCITAFNRKDLLPLVLESILNQSYKNFEIIIVDDCSTDGTNEIVKKELLSIDDRIKYIRHSKNKGLAAGRNTAIYNASGKYFTFCDDDDTWNRNYLEVFMEVAKQYDEQYCFCASKISDSKQKEVHSIESSLKDLIFLGYTPPVASQFYFTMSLRNINGYNSSIKSGVDHDLWINLAVNNQRIIWLNKNIVCIGQSNESNRMTCNTNNRINGINDALSIWRNRVIKNFGKPFYIWFKKNYYYHIYKKLIKNNLKNRSVLVVLRLFYKLPFDMLIKDLNRFIIRRLTIHKNILKTPAFFPINKKFHTKLMENVSIKYNETD